MYNIGHRAKSTYYAARTRAHTQDVRRVQDLLANHVDNAARAAELAMIYARREQEYDALRKELKELVDTAEAQFRSGSTRAVQHRAALASPANRQNAADMRTMHMGLPAAQIVASAMDVIARNDDPGAHALRLEILSRTDPREVAVLSPALAKLDAMHSETHGLALKEFIAAKHWEREALDAGPMFADSFESMLRDTTAFQMRADSARSFVDDNNEVQMISESEARQMLLDVGALDADAPA